MQALKISSAHAFRACRLKAVEGRNGEMSIKGRDDFDMFSCGHVVRGRVIEWKIGLARHTFIDMYTAGAHRSQKFFGLDNHAFGDCVVTMR